MGLPPHRINHVQIMKDVKAASIVSTTLSMLVSAGVGFFGVLAHPGFDTSRFNKSDLIALTNRTLGLYRGKL